MQRPIGVRTVMVVALVSMFAMWLAPGRAMAEWAATEWAATAPAGEPAPSLFAQGSWNVQLYGSYMGTYAGHEVKLAGGGAAVGYYLFDNFSVNIALNGFDVTQPGPNAVAGEFVVLLRYHALRWGSTSIYCDLGGGLFDADHDVPRFGSHFNFTFRVGPGIAIPVGERTHLIGGARYFHLSNGNTQSDKENPSANGAEVYVGLMFAL